jgi:hypothetical protein
MYQWNGANSGNVQMSGSPPSWYRSGRPGPRVLVFENGFLVDDTQIAVSLLRRIALRKAAFREIDERQAEADLRRLKEDEERREAEARQADLANKRRAALATIVPSAKQVVTSNAGDTGALPDNLSNAAIARLKAVISAFDTLQQVDASDE